ncbi:MAG: RNA polymerase sigma factor [Niabella sp.]
MLSESVNNLIGESCNGDYNAFRKLMQMYQQRVYSFVFRMICNEDDARDIVQETFIKVWQNLASYNSKYSFNTWLYKIASNCCFDFLRTRKRSRLVYVDEAGLEAAISTAINVDRLLDNKEIIAVTTYLCNNLTEKQRIVFILKELEMLTTGEVSAITGLSPEKIKSNLYLAKKNIREQLSKYFNNENE